MARMNRYEFQIPNSQKKHATRFPFCSNTPIQLSFKPKRDFINTIIAINTMTSVQININGGFFTPGRPLTIEKKLAIAESYERHRQMALSESDSPPRRPNLSAIAREQLVSEGVVRKIEQELFVFGRVKTPKKKGTRAKGPGSLSLSEHDKRVLIRLLEKDCFQSLQSYRRKLYKRTGTDVSESTISWFFLKGFPIKANLCKPDMIPKDKFKPENVDRYFEFCQWIRRIPVKRLKFGDEKLLKGAEVFNRKGRKHPVTGKKPEREVDPDFRNTYSITRTCGIDRECPPLCVTIHNETNDADSFFDHVSEAIHQGALRRGDVYILDNATIHLHGENDNLEEWLWENHGIAVLTLPTRAPELNPIELVWRSLVMKLRSPKRMGRASDGQHRVAKEAVRIFDRMSHRSIRAKFEQCGYY